MFCQAEGDIPYFQFEELLTVPRLVHAFTCRTTDTVFKDASMAREVANRRLLERLRILPEQLVLLQQTHSNRVAEADEASPTPTGVLKVRNVDGLLLRKPGRFAVVRTADCLPILALAPRKHALCLLHAGWRGTRDHIVRNGISRLIQSLNLEPEEVQVAVGPGIRQCCYTVGGEVREQFRTAGFPVDRHFRKGHLDLVGANLDEVRALGIVDLLDCGVCTSCSADVFYSYRKSGDSGRIWTIAGFL